jgi:hypothetical protein
MFWGCVSVLGTGCLVPIKGNLASAQYIDIITTHLLPTARAWYGNDNWLLIQDNAPCHNSKMTRQFLNQANIRVIPWPSNSPDMNIIENIWHILKSRLYRQGSGKTRNEVIAKAMQIRRMMRTLGKPASMLCHPCRNVFRHFIMSVVVPQNTENVHYRHHLLLDTALVSF